MNDVIAPTAPGKLGEPVDPRAMFSYLDQLNAWLIGRKAQLDELDAAAQTSAHATELTPDISLSMTLWQTIKIRNEKLMQTWDSGRVGPKQAEQLSTLIWGRLEAPGGPDTGPGTSLPEACKLSDALTSQLRVLLQIDPSGSQAIVRISNLKASLERLRDQLRLEPADTQVAAAQHLSQLAQRVQEASDKASRGGDVGGLLGPLEIDAATFERDLIVGGSQRRQNKAQVDAAGQQRELLVRRGQALQELVDKVVGSVANPPRYAVPDVSALGPVPADKDALDLYSAQLIRVGQAMDVVAKAYTNALPSGPLAATDPEQVTQPAPSSAPEPKPAPGTQPRPQQPTASLTPEEDALVAEFGRLSIAARDDHLLGELLAIIVRMAKLDPSPSQAVQQTLKAARSYRDWRVAEGNQQ